MSLDIRFHPIRLGTREGSEEACLGLVNENLVTILVRLPGAARAQDLSWYLETGFGPCAREGLVFSDLDAAEVWIRDQIPC